MSKVKQEKRNPWFWIPSLYYAQGIPYVVVMTVSVIMYKRLDISNTEIALYTSWLYLPWVIKPFWSPVVDLLKTKRFWIVTMQLFIGAGLAGVAFTIPVNNFFQYTLAFFWLLAFSSSTHDIAADGFYMLGLSSHQQAWFVGIRSTFYRLAMITGQGLLVIIAGYLETQTGNITYSWMITFFILTGLFILFFIYHLFILPSPKVDKSLLENENFNLRRVLALILGPILLVVLFGTGYFLISSLLGTLDIIDIWITILSIAITLFIGILLLRGPVRVWVEKNESSNIINADLNPLIKFLKVFIQFLKKDKFWIILSFILLYRLGESQLVKLASPFLLDPIEIGGLGLSTSEVGLVYGTIGITALTIGGILGGIVIAKQGLKFWLWPMLLAINLPNFVYVYLSFTQTTNFLVINTMVAIEQFGYGFGFTAYMLYLIYISGGEQKTSHYAIATGFMALGMMIPGMWSGWLQELIGYQNFFVWICIATIPGFIIAKFVNIDPEFGKKSE